MSDCLNVEVRDRLPELLNSALGADERRRVEAHVAACAECAAELELLRLARSTARGVRVPAIDVAAIVAALPRAAAERARPAGANRTMWRIAATLTFVALGVLSLASVRRYFGGATGDSTAAVTPPVAAAADSAPADTPRTGRGGATSALTAGGGVADLDDADLEALIGALDRVEAAPHADPDAGGFARIVAGATGGR